MSTPPEPTGRPSSAKHAAVPPSNERPSDPKANAPLPLPPIHGSTGSHKTELPLSDLIRKGGSSQRSSAESDIAQFLAHPQGGAANTDDAPTVITSGGKPSGNTPPPGPGPIPLVVSGEPPSIAGRRLGHFELIEAVGSGGMAAVLKARDTELGRVVALKILPPEAARDPESVTRFKQEARAAAALDHDNVARVYYCGEDQGLNFIAFEYVEGINLRQMIDRRGVLTAPECVTYMMQVAAGLNHAAERGVVHRDIKPSNILITPDGRAKIVDMGLARHLGSEGVNGGVTQSGVTLGTFDYISPEQALDPRRADVRSDIYSLGCTFYHAITGRPPVPEGTAARKLRAHQNDEPLDPRELNPAVPDELAAILAHMMAKDPARRYQTPTELIAHLKGLAERLKLRADPLANDSAAKSVPAELRLLPEAPRVRPWWVVAIAAVALAVVAFVVATSDPGPAPGPPTDQAKSKAPEAPFEKPNGVVPRTNPDQPPTGPVATVAELVKRLEDPRTTKVQLAPGTFDLSKLDHAVAFQGKDLELVGAPLTGAGGGVTKVILAAGPTRGAAGSLTVRAETVSVRNVWFDLVLDPDVTDDLGPNLALIGLRLDEAREVGLADCVFAATHEKLRSHDPRSVVVSRPADGAGRTERIDVRGCLFAAAGIGLVAPAGAQVLLADCGFAPHAAAVLIDASATAPGDVPPRSEVRADHCSFMLDPGAAAVETGSPANLRVVASDCLFAPVGGPPLRSGLSGSDASRRGVVIRTRAEKPDGVQLAAPSGRTSAYYGVDPIGTRTETLTFEECKTAAPGVEDKTRADLKQRPWAEADPLATTASAGPWKGFRLKTDTDPAVFTRDDRQRWVPVGAAFFNPADNVRRAYADVAWAFSRPKTAAEARTKVWWPTARDNEIEPGVYTDLRALLKAARPGDEILIRHTGELPVDNEELKAATKPSEGDLKVTFQPYPDSAPVLVIAGDQDRDQTLFRLKSGEVTFKDLHFRLKPNLPKNGQTVAAVGVTGGRSCTFKNCLLTLSEEDDSKVAAAHLPDIDKVMAMDPAARPVPKVVFDHCLVRGRGRCVWVEVSRPVNLEMTDSLTALDGPVLFAEGGGKVAPGATSTAKLARSTVLAGGPVVEMRGGKTGDAMRTSGLTALKVDADKCLFVAVPFAGRPLVELDGVDDPTDVKAVFVWQVTDANRYANFEPGAALAVIRPGGDGAAKEWTRDDWIGKVGEPPGADKRFGSVTFAAPVTGLKDLAAVKPADVVAKTFDFPDLTGAKVLDAGADPTALRDKLKLPLPPDEPKP